MHRSRLIVGTLLLASICLVAAPAAAVAQPRVAVVLSQSSYDATMPPTSPGATQPISLGGTLYSSRVKAAEALLAAEFGSVTRSGDAELASLSSLEGPSTGRRRWRAVRFTHVGRRPYTDRGPRSAVAHPR